MILIVMIFLACLTGFLWYRLNCLTKLETTALWLLCILAISDFLAVVVASLGWLTLKAGQAYATFRITHMILVPLAMLIFINLFERMDGRQKWMLTALWCALMVSGQYMLELLGVIDLDHYPLWLSIASLLALQLLLLIARRFFRYLLTGREPFA